MAGLLVFASTAAAGEATPTDTSTTAPATEAPATQAPVTETPATEAPATTEVPATTTTVPATTTTVPATTTTIPETTDVGPCVTDCIPESDDTCVGADCIPSAGGAMPTATLGAGALPFTGIEDVLAPLLLALTVVLGGVVAWRWAQLREAVAEAATGARGVPMAVSRSGYAGAMRQLDIEQRARQVFATRAA